MFGIKEGLTVGILSLTDGKEFWTFGNVYLHIFEEEYIEEKDIYIPLDFKITAIEKNRQLCIIFNSTTNVSKSYSSRVGNFLAPGEVRGYFVNGDTNISLKGRGINTPGRAILGIKHHSLRINRILPPDIDIS